MSCFPLVELDVGSLGMDQYHGPSYQPAPHLKEDLKWKKSMLLNSLEGERHFEHTEA